MKKTTDNQHPIRQLIKFSNYSLCITLPKDYIDKLGWAQGDHIKFQYNQTKKNLTLIKNNIPQTHIPAPIEQNEKEISLPQPPLPPKKLDIPDKKIDNLPIDYDDLTPIPPIS